MKKCFASRYPLIAGECSLDLSKEHYISEAVLKQISAGNSMVHISGAKWQKTPEGFMLPTSALTSKILCQRHNTEMSKYDNAANIFFQFLRPRSRINANVCGKELEKWFVKTLVGLYESQSLMSPVPNFALGDSFYKSLWEESPLIPPLGLAMMAPNQEFGMTTDLLVGPVYSPTEVSAYLFKVFSIEVHIKFVESPLGSDHYFRPIYIDKRTKDGNFRLVLEWEDGMVSSPAPYLVLTEKN